MLPLFKRFEGTKKTLEIRANNPLSWCLYGNEKTMGREVTDKLARIYVQEEGNTFVGIIPGESFKQIEQPIFWAYCGGALLLVANPGYKFVLRDRTYTIQPKESNTRLEIIPEFVGAVGA